MAIAMASDGQADLARRAGTLSVPRRIYSPSGQAAAESAMAWLCDGIAFAT